MPEYRVYLVGEDGHFIGREEFVCADDTEAIAKAELVSKPFSFEVWSGLRWVEYKVTFPGPAVTHEIKVGRLVPKHSATFGMVNLDRFGHDAPCRNRTTDPASAALSTLGPKAWRLPASYQALNARFAIRPWRVGTPLGFQPIG